MKDRLHFHFLLFLASSLLCVAPVGTLAQTDGNADPNANPLPSPPTLTNTTPRRFSRPGASNLQQRLQVITNRAGFPPSPGAVPPSLPVPGAAVPGAPTTPATVPTVPTTPATASTNAPTPAGQTIPPPRQAVAPPAIPTPTLPTPGVPTPTPGTQPVVGQPAAAAGQVPAAAPQGGATQPAGAGAAPGEQMVSGEIISVQGMPLDQFFDLYSSISGRIILRPYSLPGAPQGITLKAQGNLTKKEAIFAMDGVLALNNIAMIPIAEKFVKALPSNLAPQEGAELGNLEGEQMQVIEQFVTQIVKLKTLKPSELSPLLTTFTRMPSGVTAFDNNQTLVLRDYASNVKRMMEIIEKVDVVVESDYRLEVIPIRYGKVADLYDTMNGLISGGGGATSTTGTTGTQPVGSTVTGGRRGGFGGASRFGGSQFGGYGGGSYGGYGGYGSSYGGGYGGGGYGRYYPQQAATPQPVGGAQTSFQDRLRQIVNRAAGTSEVKVLEDARIVPDLRSNSLLIFASKRDMAMITNIVSKVDTLMAQVLIEAIVLEVSLGDSQNLGVSFAQNPKRFGNDFIGGGGFNNGQQFLSLTNFPGNLPSGFSYFGQLGKNDFNVVVNAIAEDSIVNVVSRPRIQTSHAVTGSFAVTENVPYVTGTYDYGGFVGSGIASRSIVQQVPIGIQLNVTPFITPDGLVVMDIDQTFGTRGRDVTIDGNPIPVVNDKSAISTLSVRDGDVIMLGGFISENKSKSKSGVPLLKDIPGLGALFRSKNQSSNRSELIILMKATVLKSPEEAAIIAAAEKSQLPGIQQAERELKKTEEKRRPKRGQN